MTQTQTKPMQQNDQPTRTQIRIDAGVLLRDLAFVLKMTQRVRAEIEADQEIEEPILA